jgi:hypothetical protein
MRAPRRRNPRPRRNPGGGDGGLLPLLLLGGGAAFLFLTSTGQAWLAGLGAGGLTVPPGAVALPGGQYQLATGQIVSASQLTGIPVGLPAGTIRLANGQYQLPSGQIAGAPTAGYAAVTGSSLTLQNILPVTTATIGAASALVSFFQRIFPGAGTNPAPTVPAAAAPAPVDYYGGTLTLGDGRVLQIGSATPTDLTAGMLGFDSSLVHPADLGAAVPLTFDLSAPTAQLDWSGLTDLAVYDPSAVAAGFGALAPSRRVGFVPVPMRHG